MTNDIDVLMQNNYMVYLMIAGFVLLVIFTMIIIFAKLYNRTTREVSLVKTGLGGKKVIMDGGIIVLPVFHEITKVNMKTLRLEVQRSADGALITRDRMRVDVGVEFYVSVNATEDGVSRAAQTLGDRTFHIDQLRVMIEGKLVDSLRSVAAQMSMDELHENRSDFVQDVKNTVSEDLMKNGLELESVSLTALDQTPFDALDENNAFNAVGMKKLADVIAVSKKERAKIDADADVAVRLSLMEAERKKIEIERDEEQARITQAMEIATSRANRKAEIAIKEQEAERVSESARIKKEQDIRSSEISLEKIVRESEITKDKDIEVAEQIRQITVAQKSEEESKARGKADLAKADAIKAAEQIETNRKLAEAEREKSIILIEATREAERMATRVKIEAQAEKEAAIDLADATRESAKAQADALTLRAEAKKIDMTVEAEGQKALAAAENELNEAIVRMKVELAKIEALPAIIAEMVKPTEKIDSIRVNHISGLGRTQSQSGSAQKSEKSVVSQAVDSVMDMALQMPTLKKLGDEVGMNFDDGIEGLIANGDLKPSKRNGNGTFKDSNIDESPNKSGDQSARS